MKQTIIGMLLAVTLYAPVSFAAVDHHHDASHQHRHSGEPETSAIGTDGVTDAACADVVKVHVNGLVCDFCARALEKVFSKQQAVQGIDVDLEHGLVSIAMKQGQQIDEATLRQLITDSGYDVTAIEQGC